MKENYLKALAHPNVRAFLRVIRSGESSQDGSAYRWLFGSTQSNPKLFDSFTSHPRVKTYEKFDGQFIKNGKLDYTTAAGAYQIVGSTWDECVAALGLPDFSPESQDIAAVFLIDRRHALGDLLEGRVTDAINKLGQEWASLPSAKYGQPTVKLEEALKVYQAYGGTTGPGAEPRQSDDPAQQSQEATAMPLPALAAPFLMGLASSLIDVFTPLAKEKITKEMARHTDKPEVAEQIAATLIEGAKTLTGKTDPVAAVAAARDNPATVQKLEDSALADLDRLLPLLERLNAMEQSNIRSAREYNAAEPLFIDTPWIKLRFVHVLSLVFVSFSGWFVTMNWASLTPELRGAVITLMVIAGWNGVRDFWMGSSSGSEQKMAMLTRKDKSSQ